LPYRVLSMDSPIREVVKRSVPVRNAAFLAQNFLQNRGFSNSTELSAKPTEPKKYYLSVMVRAKNEGRFLLEWIAHHKAIGVDHIYVYDNGSEDNTAEILQPAIESGFVTLVPFPTKPITPAAEIDFFERFAGDSEWTAFIDADEFIRVRSTRSLKEILESTTAPALAINWRVFGSSNLEEPEEGNILGTLIRSRRNLHRQIKVVARNSEVTRHRNSHNFYYRNGRLARTAEGRPAFGTFVEPKGNSEVEIHHYVARGRKDTEAKAAVKTSGEGQSYERVARFDDEHTNEFDNPWSPDHLRRVREIYEELLPRRESAS